MAALDDTTTRVRFKSGGTYHDSCLEDINGTTIDGVVSLDLSVRACEFVTATVVLEGVHCDTEADARYIVDLHQDAIPLPAGLTPHQANEIRQAVAASFNAAQRRIVELERLLGET